METISDIIEEMRSRADAAFPADVDTMNLLEPLADRLEAAWKRECEKIAAETRQRSAADSGCPNVLRDTDIIAQSASIGNAAATREALLKAWVMLNVCDWPDGVNMYGVADILREIDAALALPPRQCDVGTADAQSERFKHEMCDNLPSCKPWDECCLRCFAKWAQMPYAEEGGQS